MKEVTVKNQADFVGMGTKKIDKNTPSELESAGMILKDQPAKKGSEYDTIAVPVTSDDKFLGFVHVEIFHTTATAEKFLTKKVALAKLNAQQRFNRMNNFRTNNNGTPDDALKAEQRQAEKDGDLIKVQAIVSKRIELQKTGTNN